MTQPARQRVAAITDRIAATWRQGGAGLRSISRSGARDSNEAMEPRVAALEGQVERLEASVEGLQDALYRQAVREDETRADLRRRTEPERIARELSADARRRGL